MNEIDTSQKETNLQSTVYELAIKTSRNRCDRNSGGKLAVYGVRSIEEMGLELQGYSSISGAGIKEPEAMGLGAGSSRIQSQSWGTRKSKGQ